MTFKETEEIMLGMPTTKLDYPFGEGVAVYKVLVPDRTRSVHADEAQGGDKQSRESYKNTAIETEKSSDKVVRSKLDNDPGFASGGNQALQGSWKMFGILLEGSDPVRLSLKCDPQLAVLLRERYESVLEGYHLNKKHWNTVLLTGQLSDQEITDLIVHSYNLVRGVKSVIPDFD